MMEVSQGIHVILTMAKGRELHNNCNEQRSTHKVGKESSEKMKVFEESENRTISFDSAFFGTTTSKTNWRRPWRFLHQLATHASPRTPNEIQQCVKLNGAIH